MLSSSNYLILALSAVTAVGMDAWLGEARRFHPLVGFGWLTQQLEKRLNPDSIQTLPSQRIKGILGVLLLVAPWVIASYWICQLDNFYFIANTVLLYFAIGHKSLHEHAYAVMTALEQNNIEQARIASSYMVSRDVEAIEPISATIESVLENGNDSVFATLFWFLIAGGAGAVTFRLINTLDAMWGYKTSRYYYFGWAAARLDDAFNYVPARLTAITYALLGHTQSAFRCWKNQAPLWDSPNAGPVMSAGAGALQVILGGSARYHGEWHHRPTLGAGTQPVAHDISRALQLVRHGVYRWLIVALLIGVTHYA